MDIAVHSNRRKQALKRITIFNLKTGNIEKYGGQFEERDREKLIKKIFAKNNFDVFRSTKNNSPDLSSTVHDWVLDCLEQITGQNYNDLFVKAVPDYLVVNGVENEFFFVEVKTEGDGLSSNQIKWLRAFDNVPFKIAYVSKFDTKS